MNERATGAVAFVETWLHSVGRDPVRAARALGFETIFVCRSVEPYVHSDEDQEVFEALFDSIIIADTQEVDDVLRALTPHRRTLRGVFTTNDYNVPVVAEVAAALGLPGLDPRAARTARNKQLTRAACDAAGVAGPSWTWARSSEEAVEAAQRVGFPCVVKPLTDAASIGVALCRTPEEVETQYEVITSSDSDFRGGKRLGGALVEEYLLGYEVSVEAMYVDREFSALGVTDKILGAHPAFAELGFNFPSTLPRNVVDEITAFARRALDAIGFDFGPAHVEVKVTPDGMRLVEINARVAGDPLPTVFGTALGLDLWREVISLFVGSRSTFKSDAAHQGVASRFLVSPVAGTLTGIEGTDLVRRFPGLVDLDIHVEIGQPVQRPVDNMDLYGGVVIAAKNSAEAARVAEAAIGQLHLVVDA
ncbi:ATP-grasp domain-containing protein [Curtobacterium flaccumfaciens]|uniref:ATP-grasp domain-containing protein n=1 Tax=Curtobacterium flaccumfaciens TaxID=2035 RepID=UPI0039A07B4B